MDKADNIQEQMGNVSRETEILRQNEEEMLEIKHNVTETKNAFYGLISRLDMAEERISEIEDISIVTPQTEEQREQRLNK